MAKLKANKRPLKQKKDTRIFEGTCSNCRSKKVPVIKVANAQVCVDSCLSTEKINEI
jgi:hypothetical protein